MRKELTGYSVVDPFTLLSPHKQCAHIRDTDRTLGGFVRILEIIEKSNAFALDQGIGEVSQVDKDDEILRPVLDWTKLEDIRCAGCLGSLLAWFFGVYERKSVKLENGEFTAEPIWHFRAGAIALGDYLGLKRMSPEELEQPGSSWPIEDVLYDAMRELIPRNRQKVFLNAMKHHGALCEIPWRISPVLVFKKLQEKFPNH